MQFDPRLRALLLQSTSVSVNGVLRTGRLHFIQDMLRKEWGIFQSVPAAKQQAGWVTGLLGAAAWRRRDAEAGAETLNAAT